VDKNTGLVSIVMERSSFKIGLYVCLPIYSKKALILFNKCSLKSCEVEEFTKIRQDV